MIPLKLQGTSPLALPGANDAIQPATQGAEDPAYRAKVEEAAEKFESFFISQMLRQMRSATREMAAEDSPLRDRVNDDMLALADNTVADTMSRQRAFGIADVIVRQMLPAAEPAQPGPLPATDAAQLSDAAPIERARFNFGRK